MEALLLGGALAVLGLGWVLVPLLRGRDAYELGDAQPTAAGPTALDVLREIEFDRATGVLSPEDYAALRAEYTPLAVAELRAIDAAMAAAGGPDRASDPAEKLIAHARSRAAAP